MVFIIRALSLFVSVFILLGSIENQALPQRIKITDLKVKEQFRVPPSAPVLFPFSGSPYNSFIVWAEGTSDPEVHIFLINDADEEIIMGTYSDINGDWSGPLILPEGSYTVYAVAMNDNIEFSSPSSLESFTIDI